MSQHATNQGTTEPSPLPGQEEFCDTNWASDLRGASAAVAKVLALASFPRWAQHDEMKPLSQAAPKHIHTRRRSREAKATRTPQKQNSASLRHLLWKQIATKTKPSHPLQTSSCDLYELQLCSNTVHLFLSTLIYLLTYQSIQSTYLQKSLHGFSPRDDLTRLALPSIEAHPIATCHGRTWKSTIRPRETLCFRLSSF